MGYTADRIARLETRRDQLDAAIVALGTDGVEEYWIDKVRYRRSQITFIQREIERIEGQLSMLNALADNGGQTYARRERE